jgi:hypothetical protein
MPKYSEGGGKEQKGRPASVPTPKSVPSYAKAPSLGKASQVNGSSRGKDQR